MSTIMVLDESRVLPWVVERVSPPGTKVLAYESFTDALHALHEKAPDVVVVSVTPAQLPWRQFQSLCARREPAVPVLWVSCLFSNACDAGLEPLEGYALFLQKPSSKREIETALAQLLAVPREQRLLIAR